MTDLAEDIVNSLQLFSVEKSGGVLSKSQLESLLALAKQRKASISPLCFRIVVESHLRSLK